MDEVGKIDVKTQLHIITARAEVRNLARDLGFNTMDQARISLATSTLANLLDLAGCHTGTIRYGTQVVDQIPALHVTCRVHCDENGGHNGRPDLSRLDQLRKMLDTLSVESLSPDDVQVTMVMKGRKRYGV
jgi:hypothetical protein